MHQLLVVILKKSDIVDILMQRLAEEGVKGGSVIETTGMAKSLKNASDLNIIDAISELFGSEPVANSKMIMIALPEEKLQTAKDVVHEVCGDLTKPNAGVMFALPISFSEGIN